MYEITVPEEVAAAINEDDDYDDLDNKNQKPPQEPEIKEIWKVEGLNVIRE